MTDPLDSPTASLPAVTPTATHLEQVVADWIPEPPDVPPVLEPRILTPTAQALHDAICRCPNGGDIPGHGGVDYQAVADQLETNITAALAPTIRHPVEAKVWAGASGALAASLGLAAVTLLLGRLDVIPSLLGDTPWAGALVLILGVVLPPAASLLRGYLAAHTPRPTDTLPKASPR